MSAGQEPLKSGCLDSTMGPWHPLERSSDSSCASCVLPWVFSWDVAFEWELQLMLSASPSPCPLSPKGSEAGVSGGEEGTITTGGRER